MVFRSGSGSLPEANNTNTVSEGAVASGSASLTAIAMSPQPLQGLGLSMADDLNWGFTQSPHRVRSHSAADRPISGEPDAAVRSPAGSAGEERKSSKIVVRLSIKGKAGCEDRAGEAAEPLFVAVNGEDQNQTDVAVAVPVPDRDSMSEDAPLKTWNFRPRKPPAKKQPSAVVNLPKGGRGGPAVKQSQGQSQAKGNNGKKKKEENVPKLCVSLSKKEIEEDIFVMTGSKPSRRPKKRAKHIQRELDNIFPGLWLYSISADAYKVPDPPLKN